jgi:hypothetical protein
MGHAHMVPDCADLNDGSHLSPQKDCAPRNPPGEVHSTLPPRSSFATARQSVILG